MPQSTLADEVLNSIVMAQRAMPAKFNSHEDRNISFGFTANWLGAEDEYNLGSAVWHEFKMHLNSIEQNIPVDDQSVICRVGEDIALARYAFVQLMVSGDFKETRDRIINHHFAKINPSGDQAINSIKTAKEVTVFWDTCEKIGKEISGQLQP